MQEGFNILLSIGGAVAAIFLAVRAYSWVRYKWWSVNKAKNPAAVVAASIIAGGRTTLAQRQDVAEDQALTTHQEFEKYLDHLADLDKEREQREELNALAKVRRRGGVNAIKEAFYDNRMPTAGPLTTAIQLTEANLNVMKAAAAARDKNTKVTAGPNV